MPLHILWMASSVRAVPTKHESMPRAQHNSDTQEMSVLSMVFSQEASSMQHKDAGCVWISCSAHKVK